MPPRFAHFPPLGSGDDPLKGFSVDELGSLARTVEAGEHTGPDAFADFVVDGARSTKGADRQRKKREALAFTHLVEKRKPGQGEVLRKALARRDPDLAPKPLPKPVPKPKSLLGAPLPRPKPASLLEAPLPKPKPAFQPAEPSVQPGKVVESLLKAVAAEGDARAKLGPHGWTLDPPLTPRASAAEGDARARLGPHGWTLDPAPRRRASSDDFPPPARVVEREDHGDLKERSRPAGNELTWGAATDSTTGTSQYTFIPSEDDDPSADSPPRRPQVPLQPGRDAAHDVAVIAREVGEVVDEYQDRLADPDLSIRERADIRQRRDQAIRRKLQGLREKGHLRGVLGLLAQATGIGLYDLSGGSKSIDPQAMQEVVDLVSTEKGRQDLTRRIEEIRAYARDYDPEAAEAFGALELELGAALHRFAGEFRTLAAVLGEAAFLGGQGSRAARRRTPQEQAARLDAAVDEVSRVLARQAALGITPPPHPELDPATARRFRTDGQGLLERWAETVSLAGTALTTTGGPNLLSLLIGGGVGGAGRLAGMQGHVDRIRAEVAEELLGHLRARYADGETPDPHRLKELMTRDMAWLEDMAKRTQQGMLMGLLGAASGGLAGKAGAKVLAYLQAQPGWGTRAWEAMAGEAVEVGVKKLSD
ncbi:hypothetical protein [Roseospirillum parvum]|uniref:Uncharacterized protein n=1 Tax=Roseospirillum parvum TaxID=83401 RepID=A0A1G8FHC3_9PROT|nr:hypothetical protein [Roseospirillum parvum]SDH81544.1 hypothetical protein SAMN05421742_11420 [Roseospirillum parvum]